MSSAEAAANEVPRKRLYKIPEAMILLSISRSAIYEQVRSGRLRTVKQGRTRLVPDTAVDEYVKLLEQESQENDNGEAA